MKDRKQHVIKMAHQLFIEKGFQATSIQDILDYSGISKGTFYNYFSSKSELLIAIYKSIYKKLEKDRNDLLLGQDPADIEIFTKQIQLQMITNRRNKLITLYEEVMSSNDVDLKQYVKQSRLKSLNWTFNRFIDIFGEEKRPYLLDCAIMFTGILQHNLLYNRLANQSFEKVNDVVRYSVARLVKMVEDVAMNEDQLHEPELLEKWLPDQRKNNHEMIKELLKIVGPLKALILRCLTDEKEQEKYNELLEFILDEIIHTKHPRQFLIESALQTLKQNPTEPWQKNLHHLEQHIQTYFSQQEDLDN
jgi:AcrR family transcriptional regulator